jgi:DNA-binding XRE family transcriptional regulator
MEATVGEAQRRGGRPELARARRRLGMSQEEAAEAFGVATTT